MAKKNYNHTHHRHLHQGVLLFVWDPFGDFKIRTRSVGWVLVPRLIIWGCWGTPTWYGCKMTILKKKLQIIHMLHKR